MNTLQRAYPDRVTIIAVSVDSKNEDVKRVAADIKPAYHIVVGTPGVLKAMGAVAAVPKLFVFDQKGARAEVIYGASPDLHERIERAIKRLAPR